MFCLEDYMQQLITQMKPAFKHRLLYIGLQGSYLRKEATEDSDIDIMVVIDKLSIADLEVYKELLISLGNYEKSCGFICGKEELKNWAPIEICQLLHTTKDYYGRLKELVPEYTRQDEILYVKTSIGNLYHELCHRYVHSTREVNKKKLPYTCKYIFFIMQNIYYLESGVFVKTKQELLERLPEEEREVLQTAMNLGNDEEYDFEHAFSLIFNWCGKALLIQ